MQYRGVRHETCSCFYFIFIFIFRQLTPRDASPWVCLPHSFFYLIAVPLSLLLHFYFAVWRTRCPCLPIWVVLRCLYGCLSCPTRIICGGPLFISLCLSFISWFSLLNPFLATMSLQATFTSASFCLLFSLFVCFVLFFSDRVRSRFVLCNFLYLVTTAGFIAGQLIM